MKDISSFPRLHLAQLPTPLHHLPNISALVGKNVYVKRDDLTGVGLGGNKVRKLEFLLADALDRGCDTILTTGGAQSNHAMLTAACCGRMGLNSILVLKKRGIWEKKGNQLLNDILGADVRFVDTDSYDDVYAEMKRISAELRAKGHNPYCVPVGGSVPSVRWAMPSACRRQRNRPQPWAWRLTISSAARAPAAPWRAWCWGPCSMRLRPG